MKIGYARVSTIDQNLDTQTQLLTTAGCTKIFSEHVSGVKKDRPELNTALTYARSGDTLVVTRLDRLGRSMNELLTITARLRENNIELLSLHENIDTTTPTGKLTFHLFASIAEFERELIKERTHIGLAHARSQGRTGGRPPKLTPTQHHHIHTLRNNGTPIHEIAHLTKVSTRTIHRTLQKTNPHTTD